MKPFTIFQIDFFNFVKKMNKVLDENQTSWKNNHSIIGKKKSLEGFILLLNKISEGKINYEGPGASEKTECLFWLLDKLLGEMDGLMKEQDKNFPVL